MDTLIYRADRRKIRRQSIKSLMLGLILTGVGLDAFTRNFLRLPTGFAWVCIAVGAIFLITAIGLFFVSFRPLDVFISADEKGVDMLIAKGKIPQRLFVPRQDIREAVPTQKYRQSYIAFELHDAGALIGAADFQLAKMLKINLDTFGSPAVTSVESCAVPAEQIADELNQFLKTAQPD